METEHIDGFRLSPQQHHLWLLQQNGSDRAYRVQGAILVEGSVESGVLEESLARVVEQYEILRTTFRCPSGMSVPLQVISPANTPSVLTDDLSNLDAQTQARRIEQLFQEMDQLPFDFADGPLIRARLIRLSPSRHELIIDLSALCADATTLYNLVNEMAAACRMRLEGGQPALSGSSQYADLAEWELELLATDDAKPGIDFWRKQVTAASLSARLPFEQTRRAEAGFDPKHLTWNLDAVAAAKITGLASKYEASTSAFFLACWRALLWRLTGAPDLTIAVGCHGRTYQELQTALGLLARYLPLGVGCEGSVRFSDLLRRTNDSLVDAFDRQEYFSWGGVPANVHGDPAFLPFAFDSETIPEPCSVTEGITLSLGRLYHCVERFKIKLSIEERGDMLSAALHYDTDVLQAADVERLMRQFRALVKSAADSPEGTVEALDILSEAERRQLLVDFNDTQADYPSDRCVFHLVVEQAARVPNNVAAMLGDEQLTYEQLNGRTNQLARHLQKLGVGRGVMVGLYLKQSVDIVVGLLGIIKAGGAYVPLDPGYPKERIGFILQDTGAPVLLTERSLLAEVPEQHGKTVCIDSDWDAISSERDANLASDVTPDDFAYVIYTSGSTGRPKGVPISHRNLVHSTSARTTYYREPVGRYLLLSSFAFDSSVAGIFWTLCQGGTLVLPPAELQRDPLQVAEIIARYHVTHVLSLPSLYGLLLSEADARKLASLRTIIVAGEVCPTELVRAHQSKLSQATLFNEYGPTEGTVWSTVYNCQFHMQGTAVPIGRPIANVQIYLLDSRLQPVPVGVPGEVYIGGAGVAKGYLNRLELTAEKFISNPFYPSRSSREGQAERGRLYKTGDLARYLPDGNIEFLGRVDQQVKIRGYRIELGEIEAVLGQHAGVREAVVAAREDSPGDKRLVAYVVASDGRSLTVDELRKFLGEKVPDFMIPSMFVFLDALPLNPNGKVDRQALPEPDRTRPELAKTYVAPRNAVEEVLAGLWAEVLDLERVGIYDNFFELGGHSILVTRLVGQLRDTLRVKVALRAVFETPTVAGLSEALLKDPDQRAKVEKTAQLLIQLDQLSEDEVETMLKERDLQR